MIARFQNRLLLAGLVGVVVFSGCMTAGRRPNDATTETAAVDTNAAIAELQAAQARFDAGDFAASGATSDSLYRSWDGQPGLDALADRALLLAARSNEAAGLLGESADKYDLLLDREPGPMIREETVRRHTDVLARTGRAAEAVDIALEHPGLLGEGGLADLRQWAAGLTIDELEDDRSGHDPSSREARIVYVQLAELLAADGRLESARRVAQQVLDSGADEPERTTAEALVALEAGGAMRSARIGAILPTSGDLASVGELLREGIDIALEEYARDNPGGFRIELVVRDEGSGPETAAGLVEELEREGVVAIVGPLRSESFAAAARARRNPRLPIVSPTATEVFGAAENAYTLNALEQRELDVASDLARWTVEELGLRRGALLRPSDPALARAATLFGRALEDAGGQIVASVSYGGQGTTTYQDQIQSVAATNPDVVFAPAANGPDVLTLAPQLAYYGLDRSIILGSEAWADPAVLRRLESFAADYRVIGLWSDRVSSGTRWQAFVREYERRYRKSLRDNMLPGLSHDAVALVLGALDETGLPIPAAVASELAGGLEVSGVTGILRPNPETSTVRRPTQIRMLLGGSLVEPDRTALLAWLADARAAPRDSLGVPFRD
ncbi:MAG: penicillin-binding protein activator [Gemmatimonadota bacterium]|nr:penicillin-binding protein activator [Gemmatimonadota bacterium]